eukprot:TRINITY_DN2691_c0_g1_i3.p2 TRINITY_DN2691_c0_g1~~TRINITY_DN2691_c0_g1_i3.p2  ORF type:complete len:126 (+),score=35.14 TRINITY_DN2691_c0_g1_i3:200-577(+)
MEGFMEAAPQVNMLRNGMAHRSTEVLHPVQNLQTNFLRQKVDRKAVDMGNLYGSHMTMRFKMEQALLARHQRLPGLKSEFVGLNTLLNQEEEFGFEDVLDDPWNNEEPCMPMHDSMEIKLFGKAL